VVLSKTEIDASSREVNTSVASYEKKI